MAVFSQYDYIFAFGTIFSFIDAWNIGKLHRLMYVWSPFLLTR